MVIKYIITGIVAILIGVYLVFSSVFYKNYDDSMIRGLKFKQFFSGLGLIVLGIILVLSEVL
ncbi:hypothetical protein C5745_18910 [Sphingobacterium haloxyli]|uniref:Uncharacterized protein n=1 Tax=Sphingobacterium haloxyli TaxID=2100533 RepID=A0A2S9IWS0_9SPHI|nr:hypothetical protein C5745_18910 [Sphingobacterium haloxyli]